MNTQEVNESDDDKIYKLNGYYHQTGRHSPEVLMIIGGDDQSTEAITQEMASIELQYINFLDSMKSKICFSL
jgi:hypothetical protein